MTAFVLPADILQLKRCEASAGNLGKLRDSYNDQAILSAFGFETPIVIDGHNLGLR